MPRRSAVSINPVHSLSLSPSVSRSLPFSLSFSNVRAHMLRAVCCVDSRVNSVGQRRVELLRARWVLPGFLSHPLIPPSTICSSITITSHSALPPSSVTPPSQFSPHSFFCPEIVALLSTPASPASLLLLPSLFLFSSLLLSSSSPLFLSSSSCLALLFLVSQSDGKCFSE